MSKALAIALVLLASPVSAQALRPIDGWLHAAPTEHARHVWEGLSWGTAVAAIGVDTWESWRAEDRKRAFVRQGIRLGAQQSVVIGLKYLVHRTRPCAPACGLEDPRKSFPSGHTAMTCTSVGRKHLGVTVPLMVGTGVGRVRGGKHWVTDVLAGCGVGVALSSIR